MARSAIAPVTDKLRRRPEWAEIDGPVEVPVYGYSLLDTALAFLAGLIVLGAAAGILVTLP